MKKLKKINHRICLFSIFFIAIVIYLNQNPNQTLVLVHVHAVLEIHEADQNHTNVIHVQYQKIVVEVDQDLIHQRIMVVVQVHQTETKVWMIREIDIADSRNIKAKQQLFHQLGEKKEK